MRNFSFSLIALAAALVAAGCTRPAASPSGETITIEASIPPYYLHRGPTVDVGPKATGIHQTYCRG